MTLVEVRQRPLITDTARPPTSGAEDVAHPAGGGGAPKAPGDGARRRCGPAHCRRPRARWPRLAALLVAVAALGTVLQGGGRVLRAFGVVAVPQQYLALAITNPSALPVKAAPGSPVRFKFSVSSTHEAAVRQQWVVDVAEPPAAAQVIARGAVTVARGSTVRVPVDFAMPATRGGVVITISAPGQNLAPLQFRVATAPAAGAQ